MKKNRRLIETDAFPFEFLSQVGERESWRKEVHRPVYHVHKWWAKRLGSVFRGIALGCVLPEDTSLENEFYRKHSFGELSVFDPFMGSGTTLGEAHKLGFAALGRDINPVAVAAVRVALGPMDRKKIEASFRDLASGIGERVQSLYQAHDSQGRICNVLYYFWVMQARCPGCERAIDLFASYVIARNAYPNRNPEVRIVCSACGDVFQALHGQKPVVCRSCHHSFDPEDATANGAKATCRHCRRTFVILDAVAASKRPDFRLYAKLVLREDGDKEYLTADDRDQATYVACSERLRTEEAAGSIQLPTLTLEDGYNTRQAIRYGYRTWREFFNDRQLLALGWLREAISRIGDNATRETLLTLFSGTLEFNNLFASYKGEGTGAVRHMFSHHILKPERTPIEANVWGTPKSSGAFSTLFRSRLLRALDYREVPTEITTTNGEKGRVCSLPFAGRIASWGSHEALAPRAVSLSCGDSASTGLADRSIDLVITDPPFFDNVHYSELADFFYAWRLDKTTRRSAEVQDTEAADFARKLTAVFRECHRVLKDDGMLAFTYHHSREDGWVAVAEAVLRAGFVVVNSQPVKSEMTVATPKSAAKEPIQFDIVLVCRKSTAEDTSCPVQTEVAIASARAKISRLQTAGFDLSRNDRRIIFFGQLMTTMSKPSDANGFARIVKASLTEPDPLAGTLFAGFDC